MSLGGLVAYDSSDESEEEVNSENDREKVENGKKTAILNFGTKNDFLNRGKLSELVGGGGEEGEGKEEGGEKQTNFRNKSLLFNSLPKPKTFEENEEIEETPVTISRGFSEISGKKEKGPVKISVPSLSEFKDVDEEMQQKRKRIQPSVTGTGLFSVLPPPSASLRSAASLVPQILSKKPPPKSLVPSHSKPPIKPPRTLQNPVKSSLPPIFPKYDSNSEDEDEERGAVSSKPALDFFSLSNPSKTQIPYETMAAHMLPDPMDQKKPLNSVKNAQKSGNFDENSRKTGDFEENQMLTSTVMNLPRDEIILKNKAEVGPKLPVPEQEYHVDADGNVAFDEKAIEYLCGKRGVKRKNELIQEANIIDINGEDIKPDEREWLVKALTEEQVQRPVSLSAGPSGASKKKHQITYLAHQAKAMELELQNQWAANRLSRKQTKSKYGF